jgi:hypothetical protein
VDSVGGAAAGFGMSGGGSSSETSGTSSAAFQSGKPWRQTRVFPGSGIFASAVTSSPSDTGPRGVSPSP